MGGTGNKVHQCVWPAAVSGWVMGTYQVGRVGFPLGDMVGENRVSDGVAWSASHSCCLPGLMLIKPVSVLAQASTLDRQGHRQEAFMVSIWLLIALNVN